MAKEKLYWVTAVENTLLAMKVRAKDEAEALRKAKKFKYESCEHIVQHKYSDPFGYHVDGVIVENEDFENEQETV